MLRIFVTLVAVGVVLYALAALSPQADTPVAVPTGLSQPLAALKSRWEDAKAGQQEVYEAAPMDLQPSEVLEEVAPPQVADTSMPEDFQQPPVRDDLQQTQAAVTTLARHEDQYTEHDVLAVNRDSVKIFNRIEQLFNER